MFRWLIWQIVCGEFFSSHESGSHHKATKFNSESHVWVWNVCSFARVGRAVERVIYDL